MASLIRRLPRSTARRAWAAAMVAAGMLAALAIPLAGAQDPGADPPADAADAADAAEPAEPAQSDETAPEQSDAARQAGSDEPAGDAAPAPDDAPQRSARPRSGADEVFVPSEELEAEEEVTFPVDI